MQNHSLLFSLSYHEWEKRRESCIIKQHYEVWTKSSYTELIKNLILIIPERDHSQSTLPPIECTWPNAFSIVENSIACLAKLGPSGASFHALHIPKMYSSNIRKTMSIVLIFEGFLRTNMFPFFSLPFCFRIILLNPWFISSYHPLQEIQILFILHPILATSNTSLFLLLSQNFRNDFCAASTCLNLLLKLFEHYLY